MNSADLKFMVRHLHGAGSDEPGHAHPCHEIVYYLTGEGTSVIGGIEYKYSPGCYAVVPEGTDHTERHRTETEVLFFGYGICNETITLKAGLYRDQSGELLSLMEKLHAEMRGKRRYCAYAMNVIIQQIILHIGRGEGGDENELEQTMSYVVNYIAMNSVHCVSVKQLAKSVGYSYDYFRHKFKEYYGISAKEYILKERISVVKELLANSDKPLCEIATACGFESQSHMSVAFKKLEGATPNQYRKMHKRGEYRILTERTDAR